ncbi:MAG: hypothetical protein ABIS29_16305, partial [Vicinamibacterales bacterium]
FENPVVNALAAGWTVSGVHNWSSGNPMNFVMGTDVALDGTNGAGRQLAQFANGMGVGDIARDHADQADFVNAFFNTSAFMPVSQVLLGTYGNVPKSAISGPAIAKTDISVVRNFTVPGSQSVRLQFRGELFNAFNQVNFEIELPTTTVSSAGFGRITRAGAARIGQVALKLLW